MQLPRTNAVTFLQRSAMSDGAFKELARAIVAANYHDMAAVQVAEMEAA